MTNDASIDYDQVVEQLAERQWARMTTSSVPYASLNADDRRGIRAQVEPVLADLLALHGRQYEERALCDPAPVVWATITLRLDPGIRDRPEPACTNQPDCPAVSHIVSCPWLTTWRPA